jgi:hypothetical protein
MWSSGAPIHQGAAWRGSSHLRTGASAAAGILPANSVVIREPREATGLVQRVGPECVSIFGFGELTCHADNGNLVVIRTAPRRGRGNPTSGAPVYQEPHQASDFGASKQIDDPDRPITVQCAQDTMQRHKYPLISTKLLPSPAQSTGAHVSKHP